MARAFLLLHNVTQASCGKTEQVCELGALVFREPLWRPRPHELIKS
jgi:hypothetical protein